MDIELFVAEFMNLFGGLASAAEGFETFFGWGDKR